MNKLLLGIGVLTLAACDPGGKDDRPEQNPGDSTVKTTLVYDTLETGKVHPSVPFRYNGNESFAIYIPSGMDTAKNWTTLYCFDPKGDGAHPVQLYRELADEYRVVLIGSNVVKNGMDFTDADAAIRMMMDEMPQRFPVEPDLRLLGFSGGAKVAIHYADQDKRVKQVLYAGGVFVLNRKNEVSLLGFAGSRDMNYADLVSFDADLGNSSSPHYLVEWDGTHRFPTAGVMRDGFEFILSDSVSGYEQKRVKVSQEEMMREQLLKRKFYQSFGTKDLEWWKREVMELHRLKKDDLVFERVLGFIGLACYSYANQAIEARDLPRAEYIVRIYEMATPEAEDVHRFRQAVEGMRTK